MATPLGLHAPRLDDVRALRTKRGRREQGRYAIEGPTLLAEALRAGLVPEAVYATEAGLATLAGVTASAAPEVATELDRASFVVPDRAMARLSELETPPGLLAVLRLGLVSAADALAGGRAAVLLADVADPGNAGTLLRTAEIFGIDRAIFTPGAVEPHNPKVVRATMGALFRMRVAVAPVEEVLSAALEATYTVVATAADGRPLPDFRFPERPLLAIGNERRGVADQVSDDHARVAIPQRGNGESLNAAVAGGIIFYAFSQQNEHSDFAGVTSEKP